ncbi:carbon monoxide dehydrogenase medium chain [mine drainage metagenome]|uniref:Carbon monoxide dehydrogenase medium chain n=1 Tax=mine drainage metagenome TaxID=410659 RepID=A0A1J5RQF4_9ZZZZ
MIPPSFGYSAPRTLPEALQLMVQHGDAAKILAGGHSLLPMMKLRFAEPGHLIDINRIPELKGIREENGLIKIGAMTTENELIDSVLLQQKVPLLPEAARLIADPQVRNRGTIGGDIAHGDPGNDHPAISIALDATFILTGPRGQRNVAAANFFLGTYMTDMQSDEILTSIHVKPFSTNKTGSAYCKLKRKTGDFATAGAAVVLEISAGVVSLARIALTNVAPTALNAKAAAAALVGKPLTDASIKAAVDAAMAICDPAEDLRGDIEYKTAMAGEMTKRAIRLAASRCK